MWIVTQYTIKLRIYHDEIVGKLSFEWPNGAVEESLLHSLPELNMIIQAWKDNMLMGSFGIGSILARDAVAEMVMYEVDSKPS